MVFILILIFKIPLCAFPRPDLGLAGGFEQAQYWSVCRGTCNRPPPTLLQACIRTLGPATHSSSIFFIFEFGLCLFLHHIEVSCLNWAGSGSPEAWMKADVLLLKEYFRLSQINFLVIIFLPNETWHINSFLSICLSQLRLGWPFAQQCLVEPDGIMTCFLAQRVERTESTLNEAVLFADAVSNKSGTACLSHFRPRCPHLATEGCMGAVLCVYDNMENSLGSGQDSGLVPSTNDAGPACHRREALAQRAGDSASEGAAAREMLSERK